MGENTKIEWCEHSWNPWIGCTKVSPACANCYAERDFDHRLKKAKWGPNGTRVLTSDANWQKPLAWNKAATESLTRPRVFCASLADVFEDWRGPILDGNGNQILVCDLCGRLHREDQASYSESCECSRFKQRMEYATMSDVRDGLFALIDATPNLDWLLLTKRPENIIRMWSIAYPPHSVDWPRTEREKRFRKNVWLGTSVEDQKWADRRIPELMMCRDLAPVLFLSCEPVLGPIDFNVGIRDYVDGLMVYQQPTLPKNYLDRIDWVIAGGESGPGARSSHPEWFRSLRDQCAATNTPFHFKQWGEWASVSEVAGPGEHYTFADGATVRRIGKKAAGRLLDGQLHDGVPNLHKVDA